MLLINQRISLAFNIRRREKINYYSISDEQGDEDPDEILTGSLVMFLGGFLVSLLVINFIEGEFIVFSFLELGGLEDFPDGNTESSNSTDQNDIRGFVIKEIEKNNDFSDKINPKRSKG